MRFRNLRVFWKELEKYIVYLQQLWLHIYIYGLVLVEECYIWFSYL
jgi:hypothetical protein